MDQPKSLWLARNGRRLPADTFADMIARRTSKHFGVRLTPHRFRHCAATAIAEDNLEEFHIIRIILGHATSATAQKHYIEARNRQAFRKAQDNMIALGDPAIGNGGTMSRSPNASGERQLERQL